MKAEDFEGIESGDAVLIDEMIVGFYEYFDNNFLADGLSFSVRIPYREDLVRIPLLELKSLSVLTGKLAPWSSPFVPDDAVWCTIERKSGEVRFRSGGLPVIHLSALDFEITKRPSWRFKNA